MLFFGGAGPATVGGQPLGPASATLGNKWRQSNRRVDESKGNTLGRSKAIVIALLDKF